MCAYYWISAENFCRLWWLEFGGLWVAPADDGRLHFLLTDRLRTRRVWRSFYEVRLRFSIYWPHVIGGQWRRPVGDDCSEFRRTFFFRSAYICCPHRPLPPSADRDPRNLEGSGQTPKTEIFRGLTNNSAAVAARRPICLGLKGIRVLYPRALWWRCAPNFGVKLKNKQCWSQLTCET